LWKNPSDLHCGFNEVKTLSQRIKQAGMKVWLCIHYSDTWADPGSQTTPLEWQNLSFPNLKIAVQNYTSTVISEIKPDIVQIGNEINNGFMWPNGNLYSNENQFIELLNTASTTIRNLSPETKIMIHYA
jgi:arabinogalactan endo-1,4-beta-galactosidase